MQVVCCYRTIFRALLLYTAMICVTAIDKIKVFHLKHVFEKFQIWLDHITSRSFVVSGCLTFHQIDKMLLNRMTFLDHIGSDKNGFYHFLFLFLISNRSEELMRRSSAANPFLKRERQNSDWLVQLVELHLLQRRSLFARNVLVDQTVSFNVLLLLAFPLRESIFPVYACCYTYALVKLDAWNM